MGACITLTSLPAVFPWSHLPCRYGFFADTCPVICPEPELGSPYLELHTEQALPLGQSMQNLSTSKIMGKRMKILQLQKLILQLQNLILQLQKLILPVWQTLPKLSNMCELFFIASYSFTCVKRMQ